MDRMTSRPFEFPPKMAETVIDLVKMSACVISKIVVEIASGSTFLQE